MSLRAEYARWIRDSRGLQFALDTSAVRDLESLLERLAGRLRNEIRTIPRGILADRYRRDLLASIERALDEFRVEYTGLLNNGIAEMAALAAAREGKLLGALATAGQISQLEHAILTIRLGATPQRVTETLYARVHRDGLRLGQRLSRLDVGARQALAETLTEGIATGESARKLAARIAPVLEQEGVDNVRYRSMRIARTEINTAYREGHVAALTGKDGHLPSYARAIGWRLSPAHPRIDICDAWAGDDYYGLGAGNYPPGSTPIGHPNCLCYTVTLLTALPEEEFVSHRAEPGQVPESQRRYYDQSAQAALPIF